MRRATLLAAAACVLLAGVLTARVVGLPAATRHVQEVTGRADADALACWSCHGPARSVAYRRGRPHPDPSFLIPSVDGRALYATAGPLARVARIDPAAGTSELSPPLPGAPRALALSPDGSQLAVSLLDTGGVALLDTESLELRAVIGVGSEPAGLAFDATGERLFVANAASRTVSIVDLAQGAESHRLAAGREPYAVVVSPEDDLLAAVSRMAETDLPDVLPRSRITLLDTRSGVVHARIDLPSVHLAESAAFTPDGRHLLVPGIRVRNLLPILQVARGWVMTSILSVVEIDTGRVVSLPLGELNRPFPDPTGIALDGAGGRVFVASGGGAEVVVLDLESLLAAARETDPEEPESFALAARYLLGRFATGRNPQGLVWTGDSLAVAERLDDTVSFYGASGLLQRIAVAEPVPIDAVRRGDAVFHDARFTFQGAFSCRSCHPGGHTDGLTYDFEIDGAGRNIVLNRSLRGVGGTEPFKWIGLNPTLQRQCGPRFAMVLTRADPFPEDQLEDLVAYLESLPPPPPDSGAGRVGGRDTGAVERGQRIFERTHRKNGTLIPPADRCSTCHSGPHFTNQRMADVGTRGPLDSTGDFDVAHLTGIASKAPFLHDGRARTLEEIWTLPGVGDQHGVVTDLDKAELNDLVEFLKAL